MAANITSRIFILFVLLCIILDPVHARSFTIDYENDCFLKDGKPFRYISAGMHYFRVPRAYWKDRLLKIKAAGLNAVQTYIAWNVHEPEQGTYNFDGDADIVSFVKLVQETGLLLILRPGPYICAEWEFGGFPPWLLKNASIILRSSKDPVYISAITNWFRVLLPLLQPYLYANGGPIISAQVENEYGSYFTCDHKYLEYLQTLLQESFGNDVILFTTDGDAESLLKCGTLPSLFSTVDFGPGTDPAKAFAVQRKFQAHGPLVNSEYYTGWLDRWGIKHQTTDPTTVAIFLDKILAMNASVNMYMFEGGTNFGYMNGATFGSSIYRPCTTSYDYDAPLSEAGDPNISNQKYKAIKNIVTKYLPDPKIPIPPPTPKHAYGKIQLTKILQTDPPRSATSKYPLTMEELGMYYGFAIYMTNIVTPSSYNQQTSKLSVPGVRDRAIVFVDKKRQGVIERNDKEKSLDIEISPNSVLELIVENQGRINYGHMNDPKGLVSNVTIDDVILTNWTVMHHENPPNACKKQTNDLRLLPDNEVPAFFKGSVPPMPAGQAPQDTYLLLNGWTKGVAFLNNFNLGRYWPVEGPQVTLYVPASAFTQDENSLVIFELDHSPCDQPEKCYVEMVTKPILNGTVLYH